MSNQEEYSPLGHLKQQRKERVERRKKVRMIFYMSLVSFIGLLALSVFFLLKYFSAEDMRNPMWLMPVIYALMSLCLLPMSRERLKELEKDLEAIDLEIDLEQYEVPTFERRAEQGCLSRLRNGGGRSVSHAQ